MMKFTCNTQLLSQSINAAMLAVSPKSTLLALEGILVRAAVREIALVSYNLEMGITASMEARVEEPGEIIIPAKVFSDIVRRIESDEVTVEADDRCLVQITGGVSQFTILGMTAEEFPELPTVGEAAGFTMPMATLSSMVDMTRYAIATNDTKPVQTGCLFELEGGELTVVAVDGFRLALRREKAEHYQDMRFIVPGKTLAELLKLMTEEGNVAVEVSRKHILFDMGSCTLVSRLLEGEFLDYRAAIPHESSTGVVVNTRALINSIERTSLLISDRLRSPLRVDFGESVIRMSCSTSIGKAYDECCCSTTGKLLEMGFNNRFLLDALKNVDTDMVRLELCGPLSPMKVLPLEVPGAAHAAAGGVSALCKSAGEALWEG